MTYVALLRAVNVGGTGKLPMTELAAMCTKAGFKDVKTYIASGNVVFRSDKSESDVKRALEGMLQRYAGKPVSVVVRTAGEIAAVLKKNPFTKTPPNITVVIFLDEAPPNDAAAQATGARGEEIRLGARELYVYYPDGQGQSKLKIPAAKHGTARNMNTVAKLAEIAAALGGTRVQGAL